MSIFAAVNRSTAEGIVGVVLIEPVVLVQHGNVRRFERGDIAECIPHDFKVVVHFPSATHEKALGDVLASVAASAGKFQFFEQVDMFSLHLSVPYQIECCGKTGKTGADDIRGFFVYIFRLFGMCECFISSCGIIHNNASL